MPLLDLAAMGMLPATTGGVNPGMMQQLRALRYLRGGMGYSRGRSMGGGGNPFGQGMMNEPDYSAYTYDPEARAAATKALSPYGLQPLSPDQVNPNALLPNSGFFGRHPMLARGLEGFMFGAANTRSADTWGEGMSNIFQGMIQGHQMQQSMRNRQFEAPFEQAKMLEGLEDMRQKRDLNEAMIQWHRAQAQNAKDRIDGHITPMGRETAGYLDSSGTYHDNPGYDPKEARRANQTVQERIWEGMRGPAPAPGGPKNKKGLDASQQYFQDMGNWMLGRDIDKAGRSQHARNQADLNDDIKKTQTDKDADAYGKGMRSFLTSGQGAKRRFWVERNIDPGNEQAKQAWYKKNFPQGSGDGSQANPIVIK